MTKIFLGNAPWNKPGFYGVRAGSRWPHFEVETNRYMPFPFQLAYGAALLEREGFQVLLVDAIAAGLSEADFYKKIEEYGPDLALLEVSTPSFNADLAIADQVRKRLCDGALLAFCGPHAPMGKSDFLDSHPVVDLVLTAEYEFTLLEVAKALEEKKSLSLVPGLVVRNEQGQGVNTGKGLIVKEVDSLPWPARHFLPLEKYFDNPGNIPEPALQMWGSRGCPFSCSYCIWPQLMDGNTYRPRQPASILDEMESVVAEYGYKSVYFDDDTFNIGKERMLEFCREKIRRGNDTPWAIMARADLMDREILEAMAESGLKAVKYGMESAEPKLISHVGKNLDIRKAIENVRLTQELGIKVHLTFMFGIPGETWDTVKKTVQLARELNPESVQFSILTPLPGTRIYDELLERGHLKVSDGESLDGYFSSVVRTEAMSSGDLEKAARYAWRSWARHKAVSGGSLADLWWVIKTVPKYICNPKAAISQLKRLINFE